MAAERILVVRGDGIGDALMLAPLVGLITPMTTTLLPAVRPGVAELVVTVTVVPLSVTDVIGV